MIEFTFTAATMRMRGTGTMSLMLALATKYRRPTTAVLIIVAGLCLALALAALWNPWRLIAFHPLATTGGAIATLTLAGGLLVMAGLLRVAHTGRRALIGLVVGLVAVPALCVGVPVVAFASAFRDRKVAAEQVLATSPDGGFSIVAVTAAGDGGENAGSARTVLLVRSRKLLFSREAASPIAECAWNPFRTDLPPESVRFTAETTVAVPVIRAVADGPMESEPTITVTFDPDTLESTDTVQMCQRAAT